MTEAKKIPYVADKSEVSNTSIIDGKVIAVGLTTYCTGGHVHCKWSLDFSECSDDQILELAKRSIVITEQSRMRRAKREHLADLATRTIDVADALKAERGGGKPPTVDGTLKRAQKLTPEEQAALLEQLKELMKG